MKIPSSKSLIENRRLLALSLSCTLIAVQGFAQSSDSSTAPETNPNSNESIVKMSQFEVTTTAGEGYVSNNAARGFKTDQSLLEIPQADIVVTSDMIKDTSFTNTSDVLQFIGVNSVYQGETVAIRGVRVSAPYLDDTPDGVPYADDVNVDSYEVIKGPAQMFYPTASLSGIALKSLKKPLPYDEVEISETVNEWGLSRTVVDANRSLGTLGDTELFLRFVGAYQGGKSYWQNLKNDAIAAHPSFEAKYQNTTVIFLFDYQKLTTHSNGFSQMTPNGQLWTGWGRTEGGYAPGANEEFWRTGERVELLQKISSSWETRLEAAGWYFQRFGALARPLSASNWSNLTAPVATYSYQVDNEPEVWWTITDDTNGKYNLGPVACQSTVGFSMIDEVNYSQVSRTGPGIPASYSVPMTSAAAVNAIVTPPTTAFSPPVTPTRTKTLDDIVYYQEQAKIIPNWLTLVAGFSWANVEAISDLNANTGVAPYTSTDLAGSAWLHRFGAILNLTKDSMIYAMNSTTFSTSAGYTYNNTALPDVQGNGSEIGLKTAFFGGRLSSTISFYHEALTNQAIVGNGLNVVGQGYEVPIGSETLQGADGDVEFSLLPGWQLIATFYNGSVRDQNNNEAISDTFDNSWSLFTRYDFPDNDALKGLAVGGGVSRIGAFWLSTAGMIVPTGYALPAAVKFHEGTLVDAFVDYRFLKHWAAHVGVINILNQTYVLSGQASYVVDPSPPLTFSFSVSYKF